MKILTNKEYNELLNKVKASKNMLDECEWQYKKVTSDYDMQLNDVFYELEELLMLIKGNVNKDNVKNKIKMIMKKVGGKV